VSYIFLSDGSAFAAVVPTVSPLLTTDSERELQQLQEGTLGSGANSADQSTDSTGSETPATASTITPSSAPPPEDEPAPSIWSSAWIWIFYAAIFVGMYFLLFRPQRKREKKAKEMQASIKVGDNIVTGSGLFGRVSDVGEDCFVVEFGTTRPVKIPVLKSDVAAIRTPVMTPEKKADSGE